MAQLAKHTHTYTIRNKHSASPPPLDCRQEERILRRQIDSSQPQRGYVTHLTINYLAHLEGGGWMLKNSQRERIEIQTGMNEIIIDLPCGHRGCMSGRGATVLLSAAFSVEIKREKCLRVGNQERKWIQASHELTPILRIHILHPGHQRTSHTS